MSSRPATSPRWAEDRLEQKIGDARAKGCLGTGDLADERIRAVGLSAVIDDHPLERLLITAADCRFPFAKPWQRVGETDRRPDIVVLLRYRLRVRIRTARPNKLNAGKRIRIAGRFRQERVLLDSDPAVLRHKSLRGR